MGPWLRSHGRDLHPLVHAVQTYSFNGAVASQPRKGRGDPTSRPRLRGFNGAVASQPRKGMGLNAVMMSQMTLQWGRGFAATEGGVAVASSDAGFRFNGAVASQPRKGGKTRTRRPLPNGFNGAVASQPRKGAFRLAIAVWPPRFNGAVASQPRKAHVRSPA